MAATLMQAQYERAAQEVWDSQAAQPAHAYDSADTEGKMGETGVHADDASGNHGHKLQSAPCLRESMELDVRVFNLVESHISTAAAMSHQTTQQQLDSFETERSPAADSTEQAKGGDVREVQESQSEHVLQLTARVGALIRRQVGSDDRMVSPAGVRFTSHSLE
jgi:hypothetical protein